MFLFLLQSSNIQDPPFAFVDVGMFRLSQSAVNVSVSSTSAVPVETLRLYLSEQKEKTNKSAETKLMFVAVFWQIVSFC